MNNRGTIPGKFQLRNQDKPDNTVYKYKGWDRIENV